MIKTITSKLLNFGIVTFEMTLIVMAKGSITPPNVTFGQYIGFSCP